MNDIQRIKQLAGIKLDESVELVPGMGSKWSASTPVDTSVDSSIEKIKARAQANSQEGYVQHVNRDKRNGNIYISDWYDSDETIASYSNGREVHNESAPEGWEGTIKAMKDEPEIDNPWALAHYMKNKGYTSHKDESIEESKYEINPDEINSVASLPHDAAVSKAHEILSQTSTSEDKKRYLSRQIDLTRNTMAVVKLLYDMLLAGEGKSVQGSRYSRMFKEEQSADQVIELIKDTISQLHPNYPGRELMMSAVARELPHYATSPDFSEQFDTAFDLFYGITYDDETEDDYTDYSMRQGEMGMEESFNNGYDDVQYADGTDYFPNGADGPVVKAVGPSGAHHGDNPEQKKMQVAETHKELVYAYRKFLSESKK